MTETRLWIESIARNAKPVLVAYPLSFDWSWLYWYFVHFTTEGSPFNHSLCFDIKTAFAVKAGIPIAEAGNPSYCQNSDHRGNTRTMLLKML